MNTFLRIWQEIDIENIKKNLFVVGELSGECFSCRNVGISFNEKQCPSCKQEFRYIAFRRKINLHSIKRFKDKYPKACFIDFDDFKKAIGKSQAHKILDV